MLSPINATYLGYVLGALAVLGFVLSFSVTLVMLPKSTVYCPYQMFRSDKRSGQHRVAGASAESQASETFPNNRICSSRYVWKLK